MSHIDEHFPPARFSRMRKLRPVLPTTRETDIFKFGKCQGRPLWPVIRDDPE